MSDRPRLVPVKVVLERLEAECRGRNVRLIYDDLKGEGGVCRLRGEPIIIINRRASTETRIRILRETLTRLAAAGETAEPVPEPVRSERQS